MILVMLVVALQFGAAVVYACHCHWKQALYWSLAGAINLLVTRMK